MQKAIGGVFLALAVAWIFLRPSLTLVNVGGFLVLFSAGAYLLFGMVGLSGTPDVVLQLRKNRDRPDKVIEVVQQRFRFDGNPSVKILLLVLCAAMIAAGLTVLTISIADSQSNTWILGVLFLIAGVKLAMLTQVFYKVQIAVDKDGLTAQSLFKKLDISWKTLLYLDKRTLSPNREMRRVYTMYNSIIYCGEPEDIGKLDAVLEQALNQAPANSAVDNATELSEKVLESIPEKTEEMTEEQT